MSAATPVSCALALPGAASVAEGAGAWSHRCESDGASAFDLFTPCEVALSFRVELGYDGFRLGFAGSFFEQGIVYGCLAG